MVYPLKPTYRAVAKYLRDGTATPRITALVRAHAEELTGDPPADSSVGVAAVLAHRWGDLDFDEYRVEVDPDEVPEELRDLAPLAEKWGIPDDGARMEFVSRCTVEAQHALWRAVEPHTDAIDRWPDDTDAADFSDTQSAFYHLGWVAGREVDSPDEDG